MQRGEIVGFLGPNGAGKTSTMRMIGCISPVTDGTLVVLGMDPASDGSKIRGRLGVVPQADTLDMELTVMENLLIYGRYFDLSYAEARRRADELLAFVQLTERANDEVEPLSGGMKRRLTIARGLINEPEMVLLDDPSMGLAPLVVEKIFEVVQSVKDEGVTILLVEQNANLALEFAQRGYVMDSGRITLTGTGDALLNDPAVRAAYLGEEA